MVEITDGNVTSITFQNQSMTDILVKGTSDATPPTSEEGAIKYGAYAREANVSIADLWPGVLLVSRVWALAKYGGRVMVSHS